MNESVILKKTISKHYECEEETWKRLQNKTWHLKQKSNDKKYSEVRTNLLVQAGT